MLMHHELVPKGHTCKECQGVFPDVQFSVNVNKHCNGKTYTNVKKICSGCYNKKYFTYREPQSRIPKDERRALKRVEIAKYFKEVNYENTNTNQKQSVI